MRKARGERGNSSQYAGRCRRTARERKLGRLCEYHSWCKGSRDVVPVMELQNLEGDQCGKAPGEDHRGETSPSLVDVQTARS
jgi:hypothetical protein